MKTFWDILDTSSDADLRQIKRAYAVRLKTIRQEDDPAAFMELREAYDRARTALEQPQTSPPPMVDPDDPQPAIELARETAPDSGSTLENQKNPVAQLMEKVVGLVEGPESANTVSSWAEIFDDPRIDDIEVHVHFEFALLDFLLSYHGYENLSERRYYPPSRLDTDISNYIFKTFNWHDRQHVHYLNQHGLTWLALVCRIEPVVTSSKDP
jgi:hypothetical protein